MDYKIHPPPDEGKEDLEKVKQFTVESGQEYVLPLLLREILENILDLIEEIEIDLYNKDIHDEQFYHTKSWKNKKIDQIKAKINATK